VGKGDYIELDPEELEAVAIESKRTIDIDEFVPRAEIDELYLNNPYYIAPDGGVGVQAFAVIEKRSARRAWWRSARSCSPRVSTSLPLRHAARDCSGRFREAKMGVIA
jgi:Ku70/Ku80 beta-barrel domain